MQTAGYVGYMHINGGGAKKCAGHAMTVHASGLGPGCALSENAKLPNMQVASLENIKSFVLFIIEYSQAISKKGILRFGLTARISCLQIGRLINSSANSLKRCNENYIC